MLTVFTYLQILTVPVMGAGPLQTSYGKEVPVYSPLAQGATLHLMEAIVFHREPDLWSSAKCLQRRFYNILIIFANKFHQEGVNFDQERRSMVKKASLKLEFQRIEELIS